MLFSELPLNWCRFLDDRELLDITLSADSRVLDGRAYPPVDKRMRAFQACAPNSVKAVIIGQDPYHGVDQAMGFAFSVPEGQSLPPSLKNIFRERASDLGLPIPPSGDLSCWAERGVLLMNRVLTVSPGEAGSHRSFGWERFTSHIVSRLSESKRHLVFCLWGREAQSVCSLISLRHTVIAAAHPSPLSAYRGFFGSKPFSKVNNALIAHQQSELDWSLPSDLPAD
ncbi:uracil-DNA glycosylase [Litorivicinus sp.]|nr:uracil-DNA glycosylase [Litorivicinus sp.]MDC1207830.1 uracil-DNA glycosylase [Litorivicinus sp.]MDC1239690.1 uracil-DNA glycosylase [Litorivicinus sp.]MDC1466481.1 uracil-DNA glycosylase [Litorivicinus sp.]